MTGAADQFAALQAVYPSAQLWQDGGPVVYLPQFQFMTKAGEHEMDLLLVPFAHSGYHTRLFFKSPPVVLEKPWNTLVVCGQPWSVLSWNQVPATLPWLQILAAHLRAVAP